MFGPPGVVPEVSRRNRHPGPRPGTFGRGDAVGGRCVCHPRRRGADPATGTVPSQRVGTWSYRQPTPARHPLYRVGRRVEGRTHHVSDRTPDWEWGPSTVTRGGDVRPPTATSPSPTARHTRPVPVSGVPGDEEDPVGPRTMPCATGGLCDRGPTSYPSPQRVEPRWWGDGVGTGLGASSSGRNGRNCSRPW